uniref:RNA-directed DNA polymerase n=1 Tax=Plectus sambesii TaxID=2011161 RepID=A0A914UV91_9BILA
MLSHYQPELPIVLAVDASSEGIGAVLLHRLPDGKELPIAHASKTLTPTKKRYPQIEKEALALIFSIRKFHQFIWGRHFLLQTDHQPLVRIFGSKKELLRTAANRLQNYGIILMGYSFDIEYINTSKFGKADGLSRLPLIDDDDVQLLIKKIDLGLSETYTKTLANLPIQADQVGDATASDPTFQAVMTLHRKGWPEKLTPTFKVQASTVTADSLTPYFHICHELAIANDCLLWGLRVLIPTSFHPRILAQPHDTHPGQRAMKRLARQRFWWLGMDKDIEKKTAQCDACKRMLNNTSKVPLQPWPATQQPFQRLHIDFAGPYLDAMWLIIGKTSTKDVIAALFELFPRYGIAKEIVSDNGRQFISEEFEQWCTRHGIRHLCSAPYQAQSNGQVERFVQRFKGAMSKMEEEGERKEDVHLRLLKFLQRYHIVPYPLTDQAPAILFLNREPRSQWNLLYDDGLTQLKKTRKKKKLHFDKYECAKEKDELTVGADVFGYDKPWTRHSNQLCLDRGSLNDSLRSASTGSASRRVNDDTRDLVNFPTNLLDAVAQDDGTEDSDRPRSTNDADDVTAQLNDMLYTLPPDLPT